MNKEFQEVREFHQKFGHPTSDFPVSLTEDRAKKRYTWILEEMNERRWNIELDWTSKQYAENAGGC